MDADLESFSVPIDRSALYECLLVLCRQWASCLRSRTFYCPQSRCQFDSGFEGRNGRRSRRRFAKPQPNSISTANSDSGGKEVEQWTCTAFLEGLSLSHMSNCFTYLDPESIYDAVESERHLQKPRLALASLLPRLSLAMPDIDWLLV